MKGDLRDILKAGLSFCSPGEGSDDDQVLSVPDEERRMGLDAEPGHDRPQLEVIKTSLHCQRQPRHHVSNNPP